MPATTASDIARIQKMFKNIGEFLVYLAARWGDEKGNEDIKGYGEAIQRALPVGFALTKMTKRPFGFHFEIDGGQNQNIYAMSFSRGQVRWNKLMPAPR